MTLPIIKKIISPEQKTYSYPVGLSIQYTKIRVVFSLRYSLKKSNKELKNKVK